MTQAQLRLIYEKTKGHCHFCGDRVFFDRRGWDEKRKGFWEVDHVIQRRKGGTSKFINYLPACAKCNRLRGHRKGLEFRRVILLGLIAVEQIKQRTAAGCRLRDLYKSRVRQNAYRRKRRARR
jgi:hypothetical protein